MDPLEDLVSGLDDVVALEQLGAELAPSHFDLLRQRDVGLRIPSRAQRQQSDLH